MRRVSLDETPWAGRPVDVVTCLFSSIAYMPDTDALKKTAEAFAACVRPGEGIVLASSTMYPAKGLDSRLSRPYGHLLVVGRKSTFGSRNHMQSC